MILRVNEAHDLGESNRFSFNDRLKDYIVVPGHELFVNEKHVPHYYVPKVCGIIITSNHKTDGIYLEADDRRHYVAWSNSTKEDFGKGYWNDFWDHYHKDNGFEHVAAYLTEFDLSHFDPMAHPPRTPAWHEIVNVGSPPEDAEIADVIDLLGKPDRTTRAKRSLPTP